MTRNKGIKCPRCGSFRTNDTTRRGKYCRTPPDCEDWYCFDCGNSFRLDTAKHKIISSLGGKQILDKETRQKYAIWKNKLIEFIACDTRVNSVIKIEEIKCVLRDDGDYLENYQDGDTPKEAWENEIGAMADSQ